MLQCIRDTHLKMAPVGGASVTDKRKLANAGAGLGGHLRTTPSFFGGKSKRSST